MSQYYEGILQLRQSGSDIEQFVLDQLHLAESKKVSLSKKKKVRNGVDYYISSNTFTINLGRKLEKRFGGILKISEKLFSRDRQTSKDLYRVNVFYRPFSVRIGDVIKCGEGIIIVSSIGRKISGTNLGTRRLQLVDFSKKEPEVLAQKTAVVSKVYPDAEIINPEDYQSVPLIGAKTGLSLGEKVKVVIDGSAAFFVR